MNTVHIHRLDGCRPTPLANYLKALGILRLVAEQADPSARGWWKGDAFFLSTALSREELEGFFLERYTPTPVLGPWSRGSGFFTNASDDTDEKSKGESQDQEEGDDEPLDGLPAIEGTTAERFRPLREAIALCREKMKELNKADSSIREIKDRPKKIKDKAEKKKLKDSPEYNREIKDATAIYSALKAEFVPELFNDIRGSFRDWCSAAVVVADELTWPSICGSGGNDSKMDFTKNFPLRLAELFVLGDEQGKPRAQAAGWLSCALWEDVCTGLPVGSSMGQFSPTIAKKLPNGSDGFSGGNGINAWDFIFMLEGIPCIASGLSRRCDSEKDVLASAPFSVYAANSAFASSLQGEKGRGEQWMPLWRRPASFQEVVVMFREGRSTTGRKPVQNGTDFARSVAKLGVARGIDSFIRYGYINRNGQGHFAVPLGRFQVSEKPNQRLLDEAAPWVDALTRAAASDKVPASFKRASRLCAEASFACATKADRGSFESLILAMGEAEAALVRSAGVKEIKEKIQNNNLKPIPPLSAGWLDLLDDGTPEFHLACALASVEGIRNHYLPLTMKRKSPDRRERDILKTIPDPIFDTGESGLKMAPDQCAKGADLCRDAAAILLRRSIATGKNGGGLALEGARFAGLPDIAALLDGAVDEDRVLTLARPLMAVDWRKARGTGFQPVCPDGILPSPAFAVIRLALPPGELELNGVKRKPFHDPEILHRLFSGDLTRAFAVAHRRLCAVGLRPVVKQVVGTPQEAQVLATALAFPLAQRDWQRLARWITRAEDESSAD